jgi:hypothetical protein
VSRANDNLTTLRWFRLSDLRRRGWGEQRIHDILKNADPKHWRCHQHEQRQRQLTGSVCGLAVNCLEDKATFHVVGTEPDDPPMWSICAEEVALLLPADANGAPSLSEDAQAATETAEAETAEAETAEAETAEAETETTETETPEPTGSSTEWVGYAIDQNRELLAGMSVRSASKLLEKWMCEGRYSPRKSIGRSRIRTIATDCDLLPIKRPR